MVGIHLASITLGFSILLTVKCVLKDVIPMTKNDLLNFSEISLNELKLRLRMLAI